MVVYNGIKDDIRDLATWRTVIADTMIVQITWVTFVW